MECTQHDIQQRPKTIQQYSTVINIYYIYETTEEEGKYIQGKIKFYSILNTICQGK
jgi:hypothetical protein